MSTPEGIDALIPLVGRTVRRLLLGDGSSEADAALVFEMEDGNDVAVHVYGPCCSTAWFSELNGVEFLLGSTVRSVVANETIDRDDPPKQQQEARFHGFTIATDKGRFDVVFRGESNGCYEAVFHTWSPAAGERCRKKPKRLRPILTDWSES